MSAPAAQSKGPVAVRPLPPETLAASPDAMFPEPPETLEWVWLATLLVPPETVAVVPEAVFELPPQTVELPPLAVAEFKVLPKTLAELLTVEVEFECPPEIAFTKTARHHFFAPACHTA